MRPRTTALAAAVALALGAFCAQAAVPSPAAAAEPTPEEVRSVDEALETVRDVCSRALAAVLAEFRARHPGVAARQSGGRSKKNDYRNYQWISVKPGGREYLICAHHGNLDVRTGNPHAQFGRFQFWRCEGPHGPHSRDAGGVWRVRADNEARSRPRTNVWDDDWSAAAVVDRFEAFLRECGEDLGSAGAEGPGAAAAARAESAASALPPAERKRADEALDRVRAVEAKAIAAHAAGLRARHPDWKVRQSRGNSRTNDYRCYQWITAAVPGEDGQFWISMVFNDQDPATGNMHSQFGRIQFWSGIAKSASDDGSGGEKAEAGPHTRDAGGWRFRSDKQWAAMPRLHLWSPDYSTARVLDLFDSFVSSTTSPNHSNDQ